jgi:hypothetical protein
MTVGGVDIPPNSQSLVWNRMTETAECVCRGNHLGYYDRAGTKGDWLHIPRPVECARS